MNKDNFIPQHNCRNCGMCCGPVPLNENEYKKINDFVIKNKPNYNKKNDFLTCKFRVDNKCAIYSVRPTICRLMGVVKGMECNYGNTFELDGTKFLDFTSRPKGLLNEIIKTNY